MDLAALLTRCAQELQEWIAAAEECDPGGGQAACSRALLEEIDEALIADPLINTLNC